MTWKGNANKINTTFRHTELQIPFRDRVGRYAIISIEHLFIWQRVWRSALKRMSKACISYYNYGDITIDKTDILI